MSKIHLTEDIYLEIGENALGWPEAKLHNNDRYIGFAIADQWLHCEDWFVSVISLEESYRGRGFGQWLILALSEAVRHTTGSKKTRLTPADWYSRNEPWYIRGECGSSHAALRAWDKLGGGPI